MKFYFVIDNGYDREIKTYNSLDELYENEKEYVLFNNNWYIIKGD